MSAERALFGRMCDSTRVDRPPMSLVLPSSTSRRFFLHVSPSVSEEYLESAELSLCSSLPFNTLPSRLAFSFWDPWNFTLNAACIVLSVICGWKCGRLDRSALQCGDR